MSSAPRVIALDHIVLKCADVDTTLAWYVDILGLQPVRVAEWRAGSVPFPSVRVDCGTILDLVRADDAALGDGAIDDGRLDHFCLVVEPLDLAALAGSGRFDVVDGPVTRYGARGNGTSIYVRDPDGALVELRHY
ncbi:MAG: VOC family protein [Actinomycetota bacterium]|nr:VOC family protein [Actinomycetota bacterium]